MKHIEQQEQQQWWHHYIRKWTGQHQQVNHRPYLADALLAGTGGFISIFTVMLLTHITDTLWLMASLGASCVLAFGAWNAPFSQPRNVIGGHFISGVIGISFYTFFGAHPLAISAAVALTIFIMMITKTVHPPAGGNPIVIMLSGYGWSYLMTPIIVGPLIIVLYAVLINNTRSNRHYPLYWW